MEFYIAESNASRNKVVLYRSVEKSSKQLEDRMHSRAESPSTNEYCVQQ
jgi:hypothetical protein